MIKLTISQQQVIDMVCKQRANDILNECKKQLALQHLKYVNEGHCHPMIDKIFWEIEINIKW